MNLHRQVADNLLEIYELYHRTKPRIKPIRRARYNRCLRLKAKLALLKTELYQSALQKSEELRTKDGRTKLRVRLSRQEETNETKQEEKKSSAMRRH